MMVPVIELMRTVRGGAGVAMRAAPAAPLASEDLTWAIQTGLAPLLWSALQAGRMTVAPQDRDAVRAAELSARLLSDETFDCLTEILRMADARGIPVVLLKGVGTAQQWYPQRHFRPMRDIDLLVRASDQAAFEAGMYALGYRQQGARPAEFFIDHQHSMPFHRSDPPCWVEVHTGLFRRGTPGTAIPWFAPQGLFEQTQYVGPLGAHCFTAEMQLTYTAVHWCCKLTQVGGMIGLMDMQLILDKAELDWDKLALMSRDPVLSRYLYVPLSYLRQHDLCDVPDVLWRGLEAGRRQLTDAGVRMLHGIIDRHLALGKPFSGFDSETLVNVRWETVLGAEPPALKFLKLPWRQLFPPGGPHRYDLRQQMRRLSALWRKA